MSRQKQEVLQEDGSNCREDLSMERRLLRENKAEVATEMQLEQGEAFIHHMKK